MILYIAIFKTIDSVKDAEVLEEHIIYLNDYIAKGKIHAKGPFTDRSGGLVIFNVENMEEAKNIMEKDPAIIHKTRIYDLKEWKNLGLPD